MSFQPPISQFVATDPDHEAAAQLRETGFDLAAEHQRQQAALARRLKRRAVADGALLLLAVGIACNVAGQPSEMLRNAIIATSIGIVVFLLRRYRDLTSLKQADDWREEAVRGRGISLRQWHAGEALPPWHERRG